MKIEKQAAFVGPKQIMNGFDWDIHCENVAKANSLAKEHGGRCMSVGVGREIRSKIPLDPTEIVERVMSFFTEKGYGKTDESSFVMMECVLAGVQIVLCVLSQKYIVEIGTVNDMEDLGRGDLCKMAEERRQQEKARRESQEN